MEEFYNISADFKDYVDKYCIKTGCTVEEALKHELIKGVYEQYKEKFLCRRNNAKVVN